MSPNDDDRIRRLLDAVAFAARAHRGQMRKDRETPYVSHVFRVCLVLRHVFNVDDPEVLTAALLHDTVEDTTTDFDDLEYRFGADVARWVATLTKDKRLPEAEREEAYGEGLKNAGWQVQLCKFADIFDNLTDAARVSEDHQRRSMARARFYLDKLNGDLKPEARGAWELVNRVVGEIDASLKRR